MTDIIRTDPASTARRGESEILPQDYDPEMAAAKMASDLVRGMGTPSIVSRKFIVWHGIIKALNHSEENQTHLDTSLRLAIYDHVSAQSVNIDGKYFERFWQYLMKPKYVITQAAGANAGAFEGDQPSIGRRILNRITGGGGGKDPNAK